LILGNAVGSAIVFDLQRPHEYFKQSLCTLCLCGKDFLSCLYRNRIGDAGNLVELVQINERGLVQRRFVRAELGIAADNDPVALCAAAPLTEMIPEPFSARIA
jgi:hypothetical protein